MFPCKDLERRRRPFVDEWEPSDDDENMGKVMYSEIRGILTAQLYIKKLFGESL